MSDRKKIFIAGASGVIGRRLCPLLVEAGWRVTGTTRSPEKASILRAMGVEPVIVDVFDDEKLRSVVARTRPDIVIHQLTDLPAGLDPAQMADARVRTARIREEGTSNLVSAAVAAGVERLIAQSIAFAYAPGRMPYDEAAPLDVEAPGDGGLTARAVAGLERQVLEAPLDGIVLRYGRLYGPGTGFDHPPKEAPLHVDAAARATLLALTNGRKGIYNIAEDEGTISTVRAAQELGWISAARRSEGPMG